MKIALAQLNYHIGNFESNVQKIIHCIKEAEQKGADLVVFAEMAISGYPPRDFLEFDDFIERCLNSVNEIAKYCTKTAAIVGLPTYNKGKIFLITSDSEGAPTTMLESMCTGSCFITSNVI